MVAFGLATPGMAQDAASPPRDPLLDVAAEYVARAPPLATERQARILEGSVLPCDETFDYPELGVPIRGSYRGPTEAEAERVRLAIDSAVVERNLLLLGLPEHDARELAERYFSDSVAYAQLSEDDRRARQAPDERLTAELNAFANKPDGFPETGTDPLECVIVTGSRVRGATQWRLEPIPRRGAKVYVAARFPFRVCERDGIDPYDRRKCQIWYDVTRQRLPLTGLYEVSAEWPDGRCDRATREFPFAGRKTDRIEIEPGEACASADPPG